MKMMISLFVFMGLLCPFLCLAQESEETTQVHKAKVAVDRAGIYLEPSYYSAVIDTIGRGTEVTLFETGKSLKKWLYISYFSEKRLAKVTGFIDVNLVELNQEMPEPSEEKEGGQEETAVGRKEGTAKKHGKREESNDDIEHIMPEIPSLISIKVRKANIRLMPSLKSSIIQQLSFGAKLSPLAKSGHWYRVNLPPNAEGIILSGYIHDSIVNEIKKKP